MIKTCLRLSSGSRNLFFFANTDITDYTLIEFHWKVFFNNLRRMWEYFKLFSSIIVEQYYQNISISKSACFVFLYKKYQIKIGFSIQLHLLINLYELFLITNPKLLTTNMIKKNFPYKCSPKAWEFVTFFICST